MESKPDWEKWSQKAQDTFKAELQNEIVLLNGKCPSCDHQMQFPHPLKFLHVKGKEKLLVEDRNMVTVVCKCGQKHEVTSSIPNCCGAAWKMELIIHDDQVQLIASAEPADYQEGDFWYKYYEKLLENMRVAAEKWQTGLGALITLVTAFGALKGKESISKLPSWAQILVGILLLIALCSQITGAVYALKAAQGTPRKDKYPTSRWSYNYDEAALALKNLNTAKILTFISIVIFILAIGFTWYVPEKPISYLQVTYNEKEKICGELIDIQETNLRIKVNDFDDPTKIPLQSIKAMELLSECK